ncbi:MAG TPA: lysylphosphatidylglycerol synthase transmembrane domain-containing protein, partial [Polyangiaceae bacterium]|nr:lysylphosphatidylglycerol synthase transmembrane domain-containing protein [Polyangiaceae bacterium]
MQLADVGGLVSTVESPAGRSQPRRVQLLALVIVAVCLALAFRDVSLASVGDLLATAGPRLLLIPLPFCLAQLADTRACQLLLARVDSPPPFLRMLQAQIAGEASTLALPAGFLVGESVRPWLISLGGRARLESCIAAVSGRKCLLVLGEGTWIGLALALAPTVAYQLSEHLFAGPWLVVASVVLSVLLLALGSSVLLFLRGGRCAGSLFRSLLRIVPARWRARLAQAESRFLRTDAQLEQVFRRPRRELILPALFYLAVWFLEGLEVWLILHALQVPIPLTTAFYIEAMVATCRSLLPLTPAGLGIQDAGYVAFFAALGFPAALGVGAAFCLAKRARELLWCALGALCWLNARRTAVARPAAEPELSRNKSSV